MNSEFSHWYRAKFNQLDDSPPKAVWENISNELDIREVWTNVDSELQKISRRKAILRNISYLVISLLFFGSGALFYYYQTDLLKSAPIALYSLTKSNNSISQEKKYFSHLNVNNKKITDNKNKAATFTEVKNNNEIADNKHKSTSYIEVNNNDKKILVNKNKVKSYLEKNNDDDKTPGIINNIASSDLAIKKDDNKIVGHENNFKANDPSEKIKLFSGSSENKDSKSLNENQTQNKNGKFVLTESDSNLSDSNTTATLINSEIKQDVFDSIINSRNTSITLLAMAPIQFHIPEKHDSALNSMHLICFPNEVQSNHLIIGASFAYSNSWLLNNDTYEGLNRNNLNQTNLSFGNSYAVLLGYDLSDKFAIQTEWSINNKQEQDYVRYREGKEIQKNIEINYTHFNLLVKKKEMKSAFNNRIPASLNYLAGIQYGYIKSISRTINGNTRSVENRYRKDNYTLVLGVEYQLIIKHLWVISSGVRADIGVRNIYAGSAIIPASFNRTYNSSIELNFGINYIIPIKIKN